MIGRKFTSVSRVFMLLLMAGSLTLSGCAMAPPVDDPRLSPQQRALRQQAQEWNQTVTTGVVTGAVVGAIGGALIDRYVLGGSGARGAVIGGAAGAAGGGLVGQNVAARNAQEGAAANTLEGRIQRARAASQQLESLTRAAEGTTADNRRKLASLNQQYRAGQLTSAQFRSETETMRGDLDAIRQGGRNADKARQDIAAEVPSQAIRAEDQKMRNDRTRLARAADELEAALRVVPAA